MTDYVLDLETLGTNHDAPVVAIGMCSFDRRTYQVGEHKFYATIDPQGACRFGARVDGDTIRWWLEQSEEARKELTDKDNTCDPHTAIAMLLQFLADPDAEEDHEFDHVVLWGNGPSFDCGILASTFERLGVKKPWGHWNERCVRTMLDLYPDARHPFPDHKTKHHALHDAEHEADCLASAFKMHHAAVPGADEEG